MIEAKHTPGPWTFHPKLERVTGPDDRAIGYFEPASGSIAAAAPEMLDALRWALPLAEMALEQCRLQRVQAGHTDIQAGDIIGLWPDEVASRDAARAAIAKATGAA